MQVANIEIDKYEAAELYREYREHRHYSAPVDEEIKSAYRAISRGKMVIRAIESVVQGGLNKQGLPHLALARADQKKVHLLARKNGSALMSDGDNLYYYQHKGKLPPDTVFNFPRGSFPFNLAKDEFRTWTFLPDIPERHKPKWKLENYHILWEATWDKVPTKDPYLLRRIGDADLWLVVAMWDLSEVERAALATRMAVQ
jgi:hypothetical protein